MSRPSSAADDLRALAAAATPGPWETDRAPQNEMLTVQTLDGTGVVYGAIYDADAELIVWLRNHADALADLIEWANDAPHQKGCGRAVGLVGWACTCNRATVLAALDATP